MKKQKEEKIEIVLNDDGTWEFKDKKKYESNEEVIILYPDGTWKYASEP